jgi:hypothetical protein
MARRSNPRNLNLTLTDIRAPQKSNKRTATEATPQEQRAPKTSKRTRTDTIPERHQAPPPGQPRPTNATSTSPMERMRTFFTRACAQTAHSIQPCQPEGSNTLAIAFETRTEMATLLLTLKDDQWYLAVGGLPPDDPSQQNEIRQKVEQMNVYNRRHQTYRQTHESIR